MRVRVCSDLHLETCEYGHGVPVLGEGEVLILGGDILCARHFKKDGNPVCVVEQDTGEELFLASENRKYFFWVSLRSGICRFGDKTDANWEVL